MKTTVRFSEIKEWFGWESDLVKRLYAGFDVLGDSAEIDLRTILKTNGVVDTISVAQLLSNKEKNSLALAVARSIEHFSEQAKLFNDFMDCCLLGPVERKEVDVKISELNQAMERTSVNGSVLEYDAMAAAKSAFFFEVEWTTGWAKICGVSHEAIAEIIQKWCDKNDGSVLVDGKKRVVCKWCGGKKWTIVTSRGTNENGVKYVDREIRECPECDGEGCVDVRDPNNLIQPCDEVRS